AEHGFVAVVDAATGNFLALEELPGAFVRVRGLDLVDDRLCLTGAFAGSLDVLDGRQSSLADGTFTEDGFLILADYQWPLPP
ncbi:MAG: hypothetical protein KJO07_25935, partial [Deltaproteobacteria bacterium]|nr:hypothetical protein [Deltaproteobacteria bacterium]